VLLAIKVPRGLAARVLPFGGGVFRKFAVFFRKIGVRREPFGGASSLSKVMFRRRRRPGAWLRSRSPWFVRTMLAGGPSLLLRVNSADE
jgi:hypothetical protein